MTIKDATNVSIPHRV